MFRYSLFDAGEKKVARYQQYFCVERILERIRTRDQEGMRTGGVVWHTQGSGKSLTMVMLAQVIALDKRLPTLKRGVPVAIPQTRFLIGEGTSVEALLLPVKG